MQQIKIILTLFPFLFIWQITQAQNQQVVDSLEALLETDLSDKKRVDVLNKLAFKFKETDSSKVARYTQESIELANKIEYPEGEAHAYLHIGWVTMTNGYYPQATKLFEKAYDITEDADLTSIKAKVITSLGVVNWYQGKFEIALEYHKENLRYYESINSKIDISSTYGRIGIIKDDLGEYEDSREYYFKQLQILLELEEERPEHIANTYNNIGATYSDQSNYLKAMEYHLMALRIHEDIGNKFFIAVDLTNIGLIQQKQKNFEKALDYYQEALVLFEEMNNQNGLAVIYLNISTVYNTLNDLDESLKFALKSLEIFKNIGDKYQIVDIYIQISKIYIKLEYLDEALKYAEMGMKQGKEIDAEPLITECYLNKGLIYYHLKEFTKSKTFLEEALELGNKIKEPEVVKDTYKTLSQVEKELGNYEAAYESHVLFKELSDSLFNEEKSKQISTLEIQYETEKKDQEILNLNQQTEIKDLQVQRRNFYLIGAGVLAVLLLGLGFVLFQQNQLQNQQQTTALEQRLLRSQMNPHFIFNSLIAIQNYIYQNKAPEAGRFLAKFSQLMRAILEGSRHDLIPLEEEVKLLENYLILQQLRFENRFTYEIEVDDKLSPEEVIIPPMLAQPFLENSIEHGFKNLEQEGKILIRFSSTQNEKMLLEVEDNGMGLNQSLAIKQEEQPQKVSRATQITQERLALLNRKESKKLSFNIQDRSEVEANTQGTLVSLSIPLKFV